MRLNKRRGLGGAGGVSSSVSKLVVKNREPTENEIRIQVSIYSFSCILNPIFSKSQFSGNSAALEKYRTRMNVAEFGEV